MMGGTVIDIYDNYQVNPIQAAITNNRLDNLSRNNLPHFEEFLKKQIELNNKRDEEKEEVKEEPKAMDMNIQANYAVMNLVTSAEKKDDNLKNLKRLQAAKAYRS